MTTLIDLYNGILKYNNNDIVIVIDDNDTIWFYGKQVADLLEYKSYREILKRLNNDNKSVYADIKEYSHYKYNIQDHAIFINEDALYELSFKSKMKEAVDFKKWIASEVMPAIRINGKYELDEKTKNKVKLLNDKLKSYKKRVKILENNQKKERYPEGGYIYVIQAPNEKKNCIKLEKQIKISTKG